MTCPALLIKTILGNEPEIFFVSSKILTLRKHHNPRPEDIPESIRRLGKFEFDLNILQGRPDQGNGIFIHLA